MALQYVSHCYNCCTTIDCTLCANNKKIKKDLIQIKKNGQILHGGFLWAVSEPYWDDILNHIKKRYELVDTKLLEFKDFKSFKKSVLKLYRSDYNKIEPIKNIKLKFFKQYPPKCLYFEFLVGLKNFKSFQFRILGMSLIPNK